MIGYLRYILPLTALYLALTNNLEPVNWLIGLGLSVGIVRLIRPNKAPIQWRYLPKATVAAITFLARLIWDLIVSGVQVAGLVIQKNPDIEQDIIAIPDATQQTWITVASAAAITLTPGELVVEIGEDGTLYTHTLYADQTLNKSIKAQEQRADQLEEISG